MIPTIRPLQVGYQSGRRREKRSFWGKLADYIREFGEMTSLHGVRHLVQPNTHFIERLVWAGAIVTCLSCAIYLIVTSYRRYADNPTVVSLEKNYRQWNITFPAATICFLQRLDKELAQQYIETVWGVEVNSSEYNYYYKFVNAVVNLTYDNLNDFLPYKHDQKLLNVDMIEMAKTLSVELKYHANIFNSAYNDMEFHEILTEMGICYTYGGVVPNYITLKKNPVTKGLSLPKCNYLNSLCYCRIEDLTTSVKYYIHSPYEIPDSSEKYYIVELNMERDTTFQFLETVSSEQLRRLDPRQRNCRYWDEPEAGINLKVYSYNLCRMDCRKKLALQLCGCAPYFYLQHDKVKVCDVSGLACLAQHMETLVRLIDPMGKKIKCSCLFQCESSVFYVDKDKVRGWHFPVPCNVRFRWAIEQYSKTRLRRDIIFGFEDLLVSLGGTAAFLLGCSVLTFVEIVYFFTLRLYFFLYRTWKNTNN